MYLAIPDFHINIGNAGVNKKTYVLEVGDLAIEYNYKTPTFSEIDESMSIKDSKGRIRINIIKKYSNPDEEFKAIWRDDAPYRDLVTDFKMGENIHHGVQIQQWGRKKNNKGKG